MVVASVESNDRSDQSRQVEHRILTHLGFVRHLLKRIVGESPSGVDLENLEAAGVLGLVQAAGQFDPSRGTAFTTFAYPRIRGAILDELHRNCPLPQRILRHWRVIREADIPLDSGTSPTRLAEVTGLSEEEIRTCLRGIRLANPMSWHDELIHRTGPRFTDPSPLSRLEARDDQLALVDAVKKLPEQQQRVVILYYLEELRLKEIGEVLGLSESRISRILSAAERRLREIVYNDLDRTPGDSSQSVDSIVTVAS